MRAIRDLLATGRFDDVPGQFEAMTRLWDPVKVAGLITRRRNEAKLWREGFAALNLSRYRRQVAKGLQHAPFPIVVARIVGLAVPEKPRCSSPPPVMTAALSTERTTIARERINPSPNSSCAESR